MGVCSEDVRNQGGRGGGGRLLCGAKDGLVLAGDVHV